MRPNRDEIRYYVIGALHEITENEKIETINEQTNPIHDLGMDSFDGVDYACILSETLSYYIPDKINPFVNDEKGQARNVGEIIDLLCELLENNMEG